MPGCVPRWRGFPPRTLCGGFLYAGRCVEGGSPDARCNGRMLKLGGEYSNVSKDRFPAAKRNFLPGSKTGQTEGGIQLRVI